MQSPQRISASQRIVHSEFRRISENNNDISFIFYLKSIFLPYFHWAITIADKYRLFDLIQYLFGETAFSRRNQPRHPNPQNNPDIIKKMKKCTHPAHKNLEKAMIVQEIPVHNFEIIMERDYKDAKEGSVAKANFTMNSIFLKRLLDINSKAPNDILLKLMTYQEWTETLLKLNSSLIRNMKELENEVCLRMKEMKEVDNAVSEDLAKNRHDIGCLIRFIREAYFKDIWNLEKLNLKTLPSSKVLEKSSNVAFYI